jgi:Fe-S oxidoreductase
MVGIEPSCVAVFKDELLKLWPANQDAQRLAKQTFHFSEFLMEHAETWDPPQLHRRALLHGHCHQKATGGTGPDKQLLERMGLEVEELDAGCCGMAGGWGYEHGHYDVSIAAGERVLLPRVREAPPDTLIVSDGFSCRSQIEQAGTGRKALHVVQVIQLARSSNPGLYPEHEVTPPPARDEHRRAVRSVAAAATLAGFAAAGLRTLRS